MTTALVFGLIFIDVPVEVIVGVAPPFHASRGGAPWGEERAQKFAEIVLHHGLLLWRVGGSGGAVVGSPTEQLVFELVMPSVLHERHIAVEVTAPEWSAANCRSPAASLETLSCCFSL